MVDIHVVVKGHTLSYNGFIYQSKILSRALNG